MSLAGVFQKRMERLRKRREQTSPDVPDRTYLGNPGCCRGPRERSRHGARLHLMATPPGPRLAGHVFPVSLEEWAAPGLQAGLFSAS